MLNNILKISKKIDDLSDDFKKVMDGEEKMSSDSLSVYYSQKIISDIKKFDSDVKYYKDTFCLWNSKYWEAIKESAFKRFILEYIEKIGRIKDTSPRLIDSTYSRLKLQLNIEDFKPNKEKQYINFMNGTLTISKDNFSFNQHDKKLHLESVLDFEYDKEKVNKKWLSFLNETIPSKETQKTLQQVIGNLLIVGLKIEVLPFLYGTGANGKSVVLDVLKGVFGEENITYYSLTKITTDEKARAIIGDGKLMNLSSENKMGKVDVEVAKAYSSGEPIDGRLLYTNGFTVYRYAKFLGNVNKLVVMDGERGNAIARRQLIIPFLNEISADKADIQLASKILREGKDGVLNWILDGMLEVIKNEQIYRSYEVKQLLEKYKKDTNPVEQMIEEYGYNILDASVAKVNYVSWNSIYRDYIDYVTDGNFGKMSKSNFRVDLLSLKGIKEFKYKNVICFNLSKEYSSHVIVEDKDGNKVDEVQMPKNNSLNLYTEDKEPY